MAPSPKKPSFTDFRAAVVTAEADETAARREAETAVAAREAALLDPDEEVALAADEAARRAVLRLDRAEARLAAARAALADAEEVDRQAKVEAEHRRLVAENAALADRLTAFLSTSADAARTLIADLHHQRGAVSAFNATAPDALRVADPEAFRGTPTVPEEVISERDEFIWVKSGTTTPVASPEHVRPNDDGRTGWGRVPGGSISVERRRVRRSVVRPCVVGIPLPHLSEQLAIPSLGSSLRPGWEPTKAHEVAGALSALAVPPGEPAKPQPVERITFLD